MHAIPVTYGAGGTDEGRNGKGHNRACAAMQMQ